MSRGLRVRDVECDEDGGAWAAAFQGCTPALQELTAAIEAEMEDVVGGFALKGLSVAADQMNRRTGMYRKDVEELAHLGRMSPGKVVLANVLYDLFAGGCSTFAVRVGSRLLHARNLDWNFADGLLRKHTHIVAMRGVPAGDYLSVTWPGLLGVLTALAPDRFSVSINYVRHPRYCGMKSFAKRALAGNWPVTWAVRQVCDNAPSYAAAVKALQEVPLLAPALFMVTGCAGNEAVVIERTPHEYATRRLGSAAMLGVTNHYASPAFLQDNISASEESFIDTTERLRVLREILAPRPKMTAKLALKVLSCEALFSDITQHQVVMVPATGVMTVDVPGRAAVEVRV